MKKARTKGVRVGGGEERRGNGASKEVREEMTSLVSDLRQSIQSSFQLFLGVETLRDCGEILDALLDRSPVGLAVFQPEHGAGNLQREDNARR